MGSSGEGEKKKDVYREQHVGGSSGEYSCMGEGKRGMRK